MTATTSKLGADMTDEQIRALAIKCGLPMVTRSGDYPWAYADKAMDFARALLARQPAAIGKQEAVAWEMDWPEYSYDGMGCGLEDRNITDRYDAMKYGWDEALERVGQILERDGPLYTAPPAQTALTDDARDAVLAEIRYAIADYHFALDLRAHGGVAQDRAFNTICKSLDMHWKQGEEKARRALIATGDTK